MITSSSNAQMKRLVQLQNKRKLRDAEGIFVAEGVKMFKEAQEDLIERVYVSESLQAREQLDIPTGRMEVVDDRVLKAAADTKTPQGILTLVKQQAYSVEQVLDGDRPLLLVLENLQDPGNIGTIIRTAEGAGVTGIIMSKETVDIYNPKTIRSTMGSIYRMPFLYVEDIQATIRTMKGMGIITYAAHLEGEKDYDQMDYQSGSAFLIGNEGNGLTADTAALADLWIKIPMAGKVESLNAGIAAGILMYEVVRQRKK